MIQIKDSKPGIRQSIAVEGEAMETYDELVRLALFCANQARTSRIKVAGREAWRLAVEYQEAAAKFGDPPDIGKKPSHL